MYTMFDQRQNKQNTQGRELTPPFISPQESKCDSSQLFNSCAVEMLVNHHVDTLKASRWRNSLLVWFCKDNAATLPGHSQPGRNSPLHNKRTGQCSNDFLLMEPGLYQKTQLFFFFDNEALMNHGDMFAKCCKSVTCLQITYSTFKVSSQSLFILDIGWSTFTSFNNL